MFTKKIEENDLDKLISSDYVIFLSDKFLGKYYYNLIKYFQKYNVAYISYKNKDIVMKNLIEFNNYIKNQRDKKKTLHFYENIIEPNTLYKKILFSNEELFLSFAMYTLKKKEYKLRTFCQIAEKLGALSISINDETTKNHSQNISGEVNVGNQASIGVLASNNNSYNGNIELKFDYTNQHYNLNLNKFNLLQIIEDEDELFITKDDFDSDIDLKFLINARCINLIKKYNTKIIINQVNALERKIISKATRFNLDIGISNKNDFSNTIIIDIDFINIYDYPDCIDGSNIYNMKEGFIQLTNIIKSQDPITYSKILNFLESHLKSIDKKQIILECELNINTIDAYKYIIKKQFAKKDRENLICNFFNNNLTYQQFLNFRDNIIFAPVFFSTNACCLTFLDDVIKNTNILIYKLFFISYQYHVIINTQSKIEDFDDFESIKTNEIYIVVKNFLIGLLALLFSVKFPLTYNEEYNSQREEIINQNDVFTKQKELELKKRERREDDFDMRFKNNDSSSDKVFTRTRGSVNQNQTYNTINQIGGRGGHNTPTLKSNNSEYLRLSITNGSFTPQQHDSKNNNIFLFNLERISDEVKDKLDHFIDNYFHTIDLRNNYINYNLLITWSEFKKMTIECKKSIEANREQNKEPNREPNSYFFF